MRVFAIADLHLSSSGQKPMDVFGPEWEGHAEKLAANWRRVVGPDDLVLICGDLSWAMTLDEARPDLEFIDSLPGRKYFIRGNHDYWCARPSRVRRALGPTMRLIRFDADVYRRVGVCGVRGWIWPGHPEFDAERDGRHWRRACQRLELSLQALTALRWDVAVAMFHYPPGLGDGAGEMRRMIEAAGVSYCVWGHLHGEDARGAFEGEANGVVYRCVSADLVEFTPTALFEHGC